MFLPFQRSAISLASDVYDVPFGQESDGVQAQIGEPSDLISAFMDNNLIRCWHYMAVFFQR